MQLEANSSASGSSLLSEIATLAIRARDRIEFRTGTLRLIREVIPYEVAFFQSAATLVGADPVGSAPTPIAERLLKRHASNVWSELATLRAGAAGAGGLLDASDLVSPDSELARLLRAEQPVRKLCVASLDEGRTVLVLGRAATPFLRRELELLGLCLPVIGLGDERASEVQDALGAQLTPREHEVFDYVSRGYNNREIAAVLGTSHLTVRNQLCRLFRKVGVTRRSQLVGLATLATHRAYSA